MRRLLTINNIEGDITIHFLCDHGGSLKAMGTSELICELLTPHLDEIQSREFDFDRVHDFIQDQIDLDTYISAVKNLRTFALYNRGGGTTTRDFDDFANAWRLSFIVAD